MRNYTPVNGLTVEIDSFQFDYKDYLIDCNPEVTYNQLPDFDKEIVKVVFTKFPISTDLDGVTTEIIDPVVLDELVKFVFDYISNFGVDKFFDVYVTKY
jgi:hypothetical protein